MLIDGDDAEAEIIHPYGMNGGEPAERELARTAHAAAAAMVTEAQLSRAELEGYPYLVERFQSSNHMGCSKRPRSVDGRPKKRLSGFMESVV
jgi:hypothetical protein